MKRVAVIAVGLVATAIPAPAFAQASARCLIEVATATNEQHLLTQETYRQATNRKVSELRTAGRRLASELDTQQSTYESNLRRQRDYLENGLITQAEFDAIAARRPNLQPLVDMMRAYPACEFFRSMEYIYPSVRAALDLANRR